MEELKTIFTEILPQNSTIIVAILTLVNARLISKETKKKKTQQDILSKIEKIINENAKNQDKRFLVQFMAEIERGDCKSEEELKCAFETKEEYNKLGGDSYVDTKWEQLELIGKLKLVK